MNYPVAMYNPAYYYPAPAPTNFPEKVRGPQESRPPEGILPALLSRSQAMPIPARLVDAVEPPVADRSSTAPMLNSQSTQPGTTTAPCCVRADSLAPSTDGWQIYGLGGVGLFRSNIANRDAFQQFSSTSNINGQFVTTQNSTSVTAFDPSLQISPLVVLGLCGENGMGVRGRFWYYHESAQATASNSDITGSRFAVASILPDPYTIVSSASGAVGLIPASTGGGALAAGLAPDVLRATHDFKTLVFDLEATKRVDFHEWTLTSSVGLRYAGLEQRYGFSRVNAGGTAGPNTFLIDSEFSSAQHRFEGVGPTIALELSRSVGTQGLALYGNGRGTMLVGRHQFNIHTQAQLDFSTGGTSSGYDFVTNGSSGSTRIVPVGEFELGVQWAGKLGGVTLIGRAGFQTQTWFDAGTLTTTKGNIDFVGANFLAGLLF
ncbi:MAG: hypothetical protein EBV06_05260 [Planctomycetia bacterium]|nr:hypothetical protein [Planctomycetia bacterium]